MTVAQSRGSAYDQGYDAGYYAGYSDGYYGFKRRTHFLNDGTTH
jgi:hypothetical protein